MALPVPEPSKDILRRVCEGLGLPASGGTPTQAGRRRKVHKVLRSVWPDAAAAVADQIAVAMEEEDSGWGEYVDASWVRAQYGTPPGRDA